MPLLLLVGWNVMVGVEVVGKTVGLAVGVSVVGRAVGLAVGVNVIGSAVGLSAGGLVDGAEVGTQVLYALDSNRREIRLGPETISLFPSPNAVFVCPS